MARVNFTGRTAWATALLAGLGVAAFAAPKDKTDGLDGVSQPLGLRSDQNSLTHEGHTVPSEKSQQSFDLPGVVDQVFVKEGQVVKEGDLLAQQNIEADKAHIEQLVLLANSKEELEAEQASLEKARATLKRKSKLNDQRAISPEEFDEARLEVDVDIHKVKHAQEQMDKAALELKEAQKRLEQKQLKAKVSGIVAGINTHPGELSNNDPQHPAITVVKNDPVHVEVAIPVGQAKHLTDGQKLMVQYEGDEAWEPGQVIFIAPEADAESQTQLVKLEVPNPQSKRASGLSVTVKLPDNLAPGAAARVNQNP